MENYDLKLNRVVEEIKKNNAKSVCIQMPDGLKPRAKDIQEYIEKNTNASVMIWLGSCYGACDTPNVNADLLIQWGHSEFVKAW
ncbi:MAG: diphthamide synthesis protein [Candidatus Woesearchaeota archaeon]